MEDKITLGRDAFKALSSDTRIGILKSLKRRRKMLAELSKELRMSNSTVKEHLDNLVKVGLIVQIDDGHKWKYYELTRKGRHILHPEETKILVLLSVSALAVIFTTFDLFGRFVTFSASKSTEAMEALRDAGASDALGEALPAAAPAVGAVAPAIPYIHIAVLIIFSALFGLS
ncbi:MAG: ArsR/SmtB family transcription factor, partial [Candidatus Thorarchaeota archaeon]